MMKIVVILFVIFCFLLVFYSGGVNSSLVAVNLDKSHSCVQDGMIIVEYSGPKAQILWKDGKRTFYCETREIFDELFDDIKKKHIVQVFVQDFSGLNWGSYIDKWVIIDDVFFVIDSSIEGAMGLSYVPFSSKVSAKIFFNRYGGRILHYLDITRDVLFNSNNLLKERILLDLM